MRSRKTAKQKQEERFYEELREQARFERGGVRALESEKKALEFAAEGPRQGEPGGQLYTNLGAFLHGHEPRGASDWERHLHAELRQRLDAAKAMPAEAEAQALEVISARAPARDARASPLRAAARCTPSAP